MTNYTNETIEMTGAIGSYCGGMYPVSTGYFEIGGQADYIIVSEEYEVSFEELENVTQEMSQETLKNIAAVCAKRAGSKEAEIYRLYSYAAFKSDVDLILVPVGGWCNIDERIMKSYSAGKNWAKRAVADGNPGEWDGLNINELRQALANSNDPAVPNFETMEEDYAFEGGVLSVIKID